ncbi:MAG: aminoglycoside phosphotransferase [Betaproteobacteria bacterium]|nr:aminoglycoside phosphotransferase [Betaproteobacteria bacterium]
MHGVDRQSQLQRWIESRLDVSPLVLEPASADASFRRYFRVRDAGESLIAMDAPPAHEDCRPFVRIAGLMAEAGLNVPRVIAQDFEQGFLLLSDLGTAGYLQALNPDTADDLFRDALDALLRWQAASKPGVLPPYDEALLRRELMLFPEWYISRHRGITLDAAQSAALDGVFALILKSNLAQPSVYVHRDYMPRNLMVCEPNPGVLDFQDAVYGPITYDLASLFKDAFISWDEARVLDWTVRYWEKAKRAGLPVAADFGEFYRDFEWMGLQRHLKVLGIFARLNYRDGKSNYLEDTPRFIGYVRAVAGRYAVLKPLLKLLDDIEGRAAASVGYTF